MPAAVKIAGYENGKAAAETTTNRSKRRLQRGSSNQAKAACSISTANSRSPAYGLNSLA